MQSLNNLYRRLVAVLTACCERGKAMRSMKTRASLLGVTASLAVIVAALSFTDVFAAGRAEASIMGVQAEPFIGQIGVFGFNFAPRGWAKCDGQLLAIANYQALFSLLGTTYGGDGRTTFGLPDFRGRAPISQGQGPGLTNRPIGQKGGSETVTLTASTMPTHTHVATLKGTTSDGAPGAPTGQVLAPKNYYGTGASNTNMGATSISNANTGGSQAHANMQPYQVVNFCIALEGIYPSRN